MEIINASRRSTRLRRSAISNDYVVYPSEHGQDINDPRIFHLFGPLIKIFAEFGPLRFELTKPTRARASRGDAWHLSSTEWTTGCRRDAWRLSSTQSTTGPLQRVSAARGHRRLVPSRRAGQTTAPARAIVPSRRAGQTTAVSVVHPVDERGVSFTQSTRGDRRGGGEGEGGGVSRGVSGDRRKCIFL